MVSSELRREETAHDEEFIARGTETILLAEDDELVRRLIGTLLKQQGYTVIEAVDGSDAVTKFIENRDKIQLLFMDLIMPKMNGKEAYDEIKRIWPGVKVIFASGYTPDVIRRRMLLENNVSLMYKPILPFALLRQVRILLDEGSGG
jgi:two-component system, cell cycle sensor histidine kinase and response regulator CckA